MEPNAHLHQIRIVRGVNTGHVAFTSHVKCTCGYRDPQQANSYLTAPDAETSARGHARDTGHTLIDADAS